MIQIKTLLINEVEKEIKRRSYKKTKKISKLIKIDLKQRKEILLGLNEINDLISNQISALNPFEYANYIMKELEQNVMIDILKEEYIGLDKFIMLLEESNDEQEFDFLLSKFEEEENNNILEEKCYNDIIRFLEEEDSIEE
jgi:hypothetical protein